MANLQSSASDDLTRSDDAPIVFDAAAAREHARRIVERSGSSFRLGMRVLPSDRRAAMYAIYAFCREVDDIADGPGDAAGKLARLAAWRDEVESLYDGRPHFPTAQALLDPVQAFGLPRAEFLAVIDGMEMDAREAIWGPSYADLFLYCRRVAGAVGMLSIHAFGETRPPAPDLAVSLGNALQLTNILRDVHEDALAGRLYLPRELLDKHGVTATTASELLADPAVARVCADLAEVAREAFTVSAYLMQRLDRRRIRPAILMMAVYRQTLEMLRRRGWNRLDEPVGLSRWAKIRLVLRHSFF
ncbi:MAG: presqualene diphosphate synthase HpnD [Alphaproteobacteria bacterium]